MSKKILILSILALLLTLLLSVKVSAATITSATIEVTPSKTECKAGETIDYTISLKNLNASDGILGLGAYIEYDSNLLTLNKKLKDFQIGQMLQYLEQLTDLLQLKKLILQIMKIF